jgi:hypothetical protein
MRDYEQLIRGYNKELADTQEVWNYSNEIHILDLHLEEKKALRVEDQDGWSDEDFYEEGYYDETEEGEEVVYLEQIHSSFL